MSKRVCFDLWHIICTNLNTKTGHICKKRIMHIKILHLKNSILTTKKCSSGPKNQFSIGASSESFYIDFRLSFEYHRNLLSLCLIFLSWIYYIEIPDFKFSAIIVLKCFSSYYWLRINNLRKHFNITDTICI